jgi:hypothetical protein
MPKAQPNTHLPSLSDLSDEHREFIERVAAAGMTITPARRRPGWTPPEPIRANTSLSDAIIEERDEGGR